MTTSTSPAPLRKRPFTVSAALAALTLLATGCAHRPPTPILEKADAPGYRMSEANRPGQSEDLFVVLAFSGGGMRAAALGYGTLEELRRTEVAVGGRKHALLDEVDVISAISGGTLPATYYGLRGEKTFEEFDAKVLSRDLEMALVWRILTPTNWFRLPSGDFNRSDLFAEIYDETVFGGATFGDLKKAGGPFIMVHGTDMTMGARFSFTQDQFDAICGDLSKVTLGRAIATSTALPPMLPPMTFENHAGSCSYQGPAWQAAAEKAAAGSDTPGRSLWRARALKAYNDPKRPFIHVFDGGLSENLGLAEVAGGLDLLQVAPDAPGLASLRKAKKVVVIAVNALRFPEVDWDQHSEPPGKGDQKDQMWSIPVDRTSLDALEKVREQLDRWKAAGPADGPDKRETYMVQITFDRLTDPAERKYFTGVKTSLALPHDQVDKLREVSGRLLRESPSFKRLLADLAAGR